ncbi:hypoxanthine phosphoribosyltransferase [Gonapodya prolifera JEL478]|uniref:Hypoxanthine phosphoribosyltransferase n=1 Tax=Gonapodya prolifera (strain JEL478) TaxID=1344416 RepID=A0A139AI61_GONPJ|nr:hypoxanthine phosphoribosyltransferase [Gonapodya prolifera JEL478]|eukprot:KXS16428.1 hypoxanthine phosphoribosyltransferase [Gonapodya prolifera JEL478]
MPASLWTDCHTDASRFIPLAHLSVPSHYADSLSDIMIPHGLIKDRIEKLAQDIVGANPGPLVVVCVLKGGHLFFSDLVAAIKRLRQSSGVVVPLSYEFIKAKSYVDDSSTGTVRLSLTDADAETFRGKNILVVEDILDTGHTLTTLLARLRLFNPASLRVAVLLLKKLPSGRRATIEGGAEYVPEYVGFAVPEKFVVGYCLDYNEHFRDLDHIAVINDHGKAKFAKGSKV